MFARVRLQVLRGFCARFITNVDQYFSSIATFDRYEHRRKLVGSCQPSVCCSIDIYANIEFPAGGPFGTAIRAVSARFSTTEGISQITGMYIRLWDKASSSIYRGGHTANHDVNMSMVHAGKRVIIPGKQSRIRRPTTSGPGHGFGSGRQLDLRGTMGRSHFTIQPHHGHKHSHEVQKKLRNRWRMSGDCREHM